MEDSYVDETVYYMFSTLLTIERVGFNGLLGINKQSLFRTKTNSSRLIFGSLSVDKDKGEVDKGHDEYCKILSMSLMDFKEMSKGNQDKTYKGYNFFIFCMRLWLKFSTEFKKQRVHVHVALSNSLLSALNKYQTMINLMEAKNFEHSAIIFRSLYENIVIIDFLNHYDCCEEMYDHSLYKSIKNITSDSSFYNGVGEKIDSLKKKYKEEDLEQNYGWARKVINKDGKKIYFADILDKVLEDNDFLKNLKNMYENFSSLVHSNNVLLNEKCHMPLLEEYLVDYVSNLGIPYLATCFYDTFFKIDNHYACTFFKTCEISMDEYR